MQAAAKSDGGDGPDVECSHRLMDRRRRRALRARRAFGRRVFVLPPTERWRRRRQAGRAARRIVPARRRQGRAGHRGDLPRQAVRDALRLHALPRRLPDRPLARCRAGRRSSGPTPTSSASSSSPSTRSATRRTRCTTTSAPSPTTSSASPARRTRSIAMVKDYQIYSRKVPLGGRRLFDGPHGVDDPAGREGEFRRHHRPERESHETGLAKLKRLVAG